MECLVSSLMSEVIFGKVLCCCHTALGQCCNWQDFCSGWVMGCLCL